LHVYEIGKMCGFGTFRYCVNAVLLQLDTSLVAGLAQQFDAHVEWLLAEEELAEVVHNVLDVFGSDWDDPVVLF
jgi:hypothetical protein